MLTFPLLLTFVFSAAGAEPGRMTCSRSKADFEPSADPASPHWKSVKPLLVELNPMGEKAKNRYEVRTQWTPKYLYFLFTCPYDELNLKPDPSTTTETYKLWEWDVAELFIGADFDNIMRYREFQVSPLGEWIDLDIDRSKMNAEAAWKWDSGFTVKGRIDRAKKIWHGEMKIPAESIDASGPAREGKQYRLNLYRLAGKTPDRESVMWQPTMVRNHHTPEKFGVMVLTK